MEILKMKMAKIVVLALVLAAPLARANTQFSFQSTTGCLDHAGNPLPTNQTVFIYISTTDSNVNFDTSVPLTTTYGDDVYVATVGSGRFLGRYLTPSVAFTNAPNYAGMQAYIVVVETPYVAGTTPTSIPGGTYYGYQTYTYGPLNETAGGTGSPNAFQNCQPIQTSYQNVPEPTTFALLGLGLGIVALRRRLKH